MVYLGDDPRKHKKGREEMRQGREESQKRVYFKSYHCEQLGLNPTGELWEMAWDFPR